MTTIKPFRESKCTDCMKDDDYSIKPTISGRCFQKDSKFHYQTFQKEKYQAKQKDKPIKQAKVKQVSDKRAKELRLYSKLRKEFLSIHEVCEAKLEGCTYEATEVHHRMGRENDLLNDTDKWLAICSSCHRLITDDSKMAIELGLSYARNQSA